MNYPTAVVGQADGTALIVDKFNDRIRVITAMPSSNRLQIAPAQLSFIAEKDGSITPAQSVTITSSITGLPFAVSKTTSGNIDWLRISPTSGTTPAVIQITADPAMLETGTYQARLTVTSSLDPTNSAIAGVSLQVARPAKLSLDASPISFAFPEPSATQTARLDIRNIGSGTASFTVSATPSTWLQVSPLGGTVFASVPTQITVTANATALERGTYNGAITIKSASTGDEIGIPVVLFIGTSQPRLLLSQAGLSFTAIAQGGAPLPQSFNVFNTAVGTLNWTATAITLQPDTEWLTIDKNSGAAGPAYSDSATVNVLIDPARLDPGTYFGQILVSAIQASNSPQAVSVTIEVLSPGSNPGPEVRPTGLVFIPDQ